MTEKERIESQLSFFPLSWNKLLEEEKKEDYFKALISKVAEEYLNYIVYPKVEEVYTALSLVDCKDVKVVIIGQDPYYNENQADGLAFSVKSGIDLPPSLRNIFKELQIEYGYPIPKNGSLEKWAKQGVLLLNTSLTVRAGLPTSHSKYGWEEFTDHLISKIDNLRDNIVFLLWGNFAKGKEKYIINNKNNIVFCAHPSPLSANRGFFNSNCFKKVNEKLITKGLKEIDFQIEADEQMKLF